MPTAWAPTAGRVVSNVDRAACERWPVWPWPGPGQALVQLLLAAEQQAAGYADVVEDHLRGVRRPDTHLLELLAHGEALGARRHDEAGLAPALETGVDGGHHHVDVGDATVGDPGLGAVEHPLVGGLVVRRRGSASS